MNATKLAVIVGSCAIVVVVCACILVDLSARQLAADIDAAIMLSEARIIDAVAREDFALAVRDLTTEQRLDYIAILTTGRRDGIEPTPQSQAERLGE